MDTNTSRHDRSPRYHSEFRLVLMSTSSDTGGEEEALRRAVLSELRRAARERGVLVVESDPRWETSLAPERSKEILAAHMNELHGYRPVFVGILRSGGSPEHHADGPRMPWLQNMGSDDESLQAMKFIDHVMENPLMRDRLFLYILKPASGEGRSAQGPTASQEALDRLLTRARAGGFALREGIAGFETLHNHILNDLLGVLNRLHPSDQALSLLQRYRWLQETFAAPHRLVYQELPGHFDRLDEHGAGNAAPLFITGEPGAGKTALLANWMAYYRKDHPDVPIICHHVGALSTTGDRSSLLHHILAELKDLYEIPQPIPDDGNALATSLPLWLELAAEKRMILIIDGLDHLDDASQTLDWLPPDIPSNIRLILSTSDERGGQEIRERLIDRDWEEYPLKSPTLMQQRTIIGRMVAERGGELGLDLLQRFTLGNTTSNPLFLRMSIRQIQKAVTPHEQERLLAAGTREEFFAQMFHQLETNHGEPLVREVVSLLWGARKGLGVSDLAHLTTADSERLQRLIDAIDQYLVARGELLAFIHTYVRQEVERRYLPERVDRKRVHRRLAHYFAGQPYSLRRSEEEPWQWEQAGERRRLAGCIADIEMFMLLSGEERWPELRKYWVTLNDEKLLIDSYEQSFAEWSARMPDRLEHAVVADRLGWFFTESGMMEPGEEYLRLALTLRQELHGPAHRATAEALHYLADHLRLAGTFAEAEEHYRSALAISEGEPEPDKLRIAEILGNLGHLYRDWGRHQDALPFYQRAMELKEQVYETDHISIAESLNALGLLYQDLRKFTMAIPLYRRAVEIRERRLGPNHPYTAMSLNNLAGACRDAGQMEEAETLYYRALAIHERMLGRTHHSTLTTLANIASLLAVQKRFQEAKKMFERAITSTVASLGEEHPTTIALHISYAHMLRYSGDHDAAERVLRHTLPLARHALGTTHPYVATCCNNLAIILHLTKRYDEALPLFTDAIAAWESSMGPDHPNIVVPLLKLGDIHLVTRKDYQKALECTERALRICMEAFGIEHGMTKQVLEFKAKIEHCLEEHSGDEGSSASVRNDQEDGR